MPFNLDRLLIEQAELQGKLIHIREFQETAEHAALNPMDKYLLATQQFHMTEYQKALLKRIDSINRASPPVCNTPPDSQLP